MTDRARVALIGDYDPRVVAHQAIPAALALAGAALGAAVEPAWVRTDSVAEDVAPQLDGFDGVWCVPASPYASMDGALRAIRFARTTGRPFLGTCAGFQHALIEYARNVLHLLDADHAETNPDAALLLITPLGCSLVEATGGIRFAEGSRLRAIYGRADSVEGYHCNFGVNPAYAALFDSGALRITATDDAGEPRAVELDDHPFYIATLYQPERSSLRGEGHPLITAFVAALAERAHARTSSSPSASSPLR